MPQPIEALRETERPTTVLPESDGRTFVVDLGPTASAANVDVVDETLIIVIDGDQHELSLPEGNAQAFIRNGILTVTTEETG